MFLALFAFAAIVLFVLAGLNVSGKRFNPGWFGVACAAVVALFPVIQLVTR